MFGWLIKKIQTSAIRSQEKDLLLFVQSLKGMTEDELASLLVMATRQRLFFPQMGVQLTEYLDGGAPIGCYRYSLRVVSAAKEMQKVKDFAAAGSLMVWVHSTRAITSPALRLHGKLMWSELKRGFPRMTAAWDSLYHVGLPLETVSVRDCLYVPLLLDQEIK